LRCDNALGVLTERSEVRVCQSIYCKY